MSSVIVYVALACCGYKTLQIHLPLIEGKVKTIKCPHGELKIQYEQTKPKANNYEQHQTGV
jgi:hypothetical protein